MKLVRDVTTFKLARGDGQGPAGTSATPVIVTFDTDDLTAGVLTVTHSKGISYVPPFSLTNPAGNTVLIGGALDGVNAFTIDFGGSITAGNWLLAYMV